MKILWEKKDNNSLKKVNLPTHAASKRACVYNRYPTLSFIVQAIRLVSLQ